jgi:hypothetical protein
MQFNMNWRADNKKAIRASEENKERCSTSLLKLSYRSSIKMDWALPPRSTNICTVASVSKSTNHASEHTVIMMDPSLAPLPPISLAL